MGQRFKKLLKRYWTVLWIATASLALISVFTYAAFTKTNRAKSVVARYGSVSTRFSSNYLATVAREKPMYVTSTDGKFGDSIFINNFALTNPTYHYDTVINYKLEMKLGYMSGSSFVAINGSTDPAVFDLGERYIIATVNSYNGTTVKTTRFGYNPGQTTIYADTILKNNNDEYLLSLPGTSSVSDIVTLTFSTNQKDSLFAETPIFTKKLYLEVTATPDPISSYSGLEPLTAWICLDKSTKVESITWTGDYNEDRSGQTPDELDGYNYVIQGMGAGTAKLRWKCDTLEINEQFLIDELGISVDNLPVASNWWKEVTFNVNANSGKNRYDLQFYRTGFQFDTAYDTWDKMDTYVEFIFPYDGQ